MTRVQPKILMLSVFAALCTACGEPDEADGGGGGGDGGVADGGGGDGGVADGGVADGGGGDGGSPDGGGKETGDPGIAFVEVVNDLIPSVTCGPTKSDTVACAEEDLVVLAAYSDAEFISLFSDNIPVAPPAVDLKSEIALISYLPLCPTLNETLRVDRVDLAGTALVVDETRVDADGGDEPACLYNVVTIPVVEFDTITATLTVAGAG